MAISSNFDTDAPWWREYTTGKQKSRFGTPAEACDALLADLKRTRTRPPAEATPSAADARRGTFYPSMRTSGSSSSAGWEAIQVRDRTQEEV